MEPSGIDKSELLAVRADLMRSRLARTLGSLDRRRREAMNVPRELTRHLGAVAVFAGVCATGFVVLGIYRASTAARRRRRERWRMVRRVWDHPEQAARPKDTILGALARTLVVGAARMLLSRLLTAEEESPSAPRARAQLPR